MVSNEADEYAEMLDEFDYLYQVQVYEDMESYVTKKYDNTWTKNDEKVYSEGIFGERTVTKSYELKGLSCGYDAVYMNAYRRGTCYPYGYQYNIIYKPQEEKDMVKRRLRRNFKITKTNDIRMERLMMNTPFPGNPALKELSELKYAGVFFELLNKHSIELKERLKADKYKKKLKGSKKKKTMFFE